MRTRALAGILAAGFVLLHSAAAELPKIPNPAGRYGIGRVEFAWKDPARPRRELMVWIWYPAATKSAETRGAYYPGAPEFDKIPEVQVRMHRSFGANWSAILSGAIYSHAVDRAAAAKAPGRFPLVTFSHGAGGTGFNYTCLIEDLVSHGYAVAAIEHTGAAKAIWFPDGRVIPMQDDNPPPNLSPAERAEWKGSRISAGIEEGAADVRFVLDRLAANGLAGSPLDGRIDFGRVAAMGHSAGAEFAARACQLDARFKACVDLDGGMVPVAALPLYDDGAAPKQPLLFLEAYHPESQIAATHEELAAYLKKREEQLTACPRGSYAVVILSPGIAHPSFSDTPLLFAGQDGFPETPVVLHNLDLIERVTREFLGKVLLGEKAALFAGGVQPIPEATVQPYGR